MEGREGGRRGGGGRGEGGGEGREEVGSKERVEGRGKRTRGDGGLEKSVKSKIKCKNSTDSHTIHHRGTQ